MVKERQIELIWLIYENQPIGISEISKLLNSSVSIPTLNRDLAILKQERLISSSGKGPSVKYSINLNSLIHLPIKVDNYFKKETDERTIIEKFNIEIFNLISNQEIFSVEENKLLSDLTKTFQDKTKRYSHPEYVKEFERLMIELSWKSSQIEGNTYDLLDTEQLLKYNIESSSNTKEEAIMLLNHKSAIEYTFQHAKEYKKLNLKDLNEIHSLLTQKMEIRKGIRNRIVRITGTKYIPPENSFLIEDSLNSMINLIHLRKSVFDKAFLAILFISYIQPFEDGNKRTARLLGNAILMSENCCPLSYRSVSPSEYKKAILLFYELNNIIAFKDIFINQFKFAVNNYF